MSLFRLAQQLEQEDPVPLTLAQRQERSRRLRLQAEFHKKITFLSKRDQGRVMQVFREFVFGENSITPTNTVKVGLNSYVQAANAHLVMKDQLP